MRNIMPQKVTAHPFFEFAVMAAISIFLGCLGLILLPRFSIGSVVFVLIFCVGLILGHSWLYGHNVKNTVNEQSKLKSVQTALKIVTWLSISITLSIVGVVAILVAP